MRAEAELIAEENRQAFSVIEGTADTKKNIGFLAVKRVFDVVASVLALIVLSPVFLLTAIAIKIEDGGPVLFVQERTGFDGKTFRMYKFRSMCINAAELHKKLLDRNEMDGPAFKMKHDPRITKVGRFIRRTSIDELPQLVNIIKGEMSVVGPRPLATYEAVQCQPWQKERLKMKPGLTCYWQCSGRSDIPFDEWMKLDAKYIQDAGIITDLKILLKTVIVVIRGSGAY